MPIPNTITRVLDLTHPQEKVWGALSTIEGLTGWFGSKAEGEVAPGHDVRMYWGDQDAEGTLEIKVVDPMSVFAYCWTISGAPAGDPGGPTSSSPSSRQTPARSSPSPRAASRSSLTSGWRPATRATPRAGRHELGELVAYLDAA